MNLSGFESFTAKSNMKIEKKHQIGDVTIFIAEGYCKGDKDDLDPHFKVMYAIAEGVDNFKLCEGFTVKFRYPMMTKNDRIETALARAKEFMANSVYGSDGDVINIKERRAARKTLN